MKIVISLFVCRQNAESSADERSFSPSPFDSIHRASVDQSPQLKMNIDTGSSCLSNVDVNIHIFTRVARFFSSQATNWLQKSCNKCVRVVVLIESVHITRARLPSFNISSEITHTHTHTHHQSLGPSRLVAGVTDVTL